MLPFPTSFLSLSRPNIDESYVIFGGFIVHLQLPLLGHEECAVSTRSHKTATSVKSIAFKTISSIARSLEEQVRYDEKTPKTLDLTHVNLE